MTLVPSTCQQTDYDDLIARARALVPLLRQRTKEMDQLRQLPEATVKDLLDAKLFQLTTPRVYGGYQVEMPPPPGPSHSSMSVTGSSQRSFLKRSNGRSFLPREEHAVAASCNPGNAKSSGSKEAISSKKGYGALSRSGKVGLVLCQ